MSLLFNGSKTAVIAGTVLQCVEVYVGESYTFPMTFTDSAGSPVNITGWTLTPTVKYYTANISYASNSTTSDITLTNVTLITAPSPATVTTGIVSGPSGTAWMSIPATLNGGLSIGLDSAPATICVITLTVSRTDSVSSTTDISKEPIGIILRYI